MAWVDEARTWLVESGLGDTDVSRATGLTDKFVKRVRDREGYEPGGRKLEILHTYLKAQRLSAKIEAV